MERRNPKVLSIPARRAVRKLGQDIRDARRRRRLSSALLAERAAISRTTLHKIESGEPGVSLGNYAAVLFSLGLIDRLAELADVTQDPTGLALVDEQLPQRVRRSAPRRQASRGDG
jgi:transcriptional regulator with XRE-family HTH domain